MNSVNLNEERFYNYVKNFMDQGATILGGCCETDSSHIRELSKLK